MNFVISFGSGKWFYFYYMLLLINSYLKTTKCEKQHYLHYTESVLWFKFADCCKMGAPCISNTEKENTSEWNLQIKIQSYDTWKL